MVEIMQQPGEVKKQNLLQSQRQVRIHGLKKAWYAVSSPTVFGEEMIAELPSLKDTSLIGRNVKVSLSELTKNYKHMHTTVMLKISNIDGKKAKPSTQARNF